VGNAAFSTGFPRPPPGSFENLIGGEEGMDGMPGARYSTAFKQKMVEKLLHPNGPSAWALSRECGVTYTTLSRWESDARTLGGMSKKKDTEKRKRWTTEEKLRIVTQASELSDDELGAFLRREGVHTSQLEQWREVVHGAFGGQSPEARRRTLADRKRIRELERELNRKEKALAEAAALMWLKKKAQAIWGDEDDDTPSGNGQ
jgi:transposase-like protein